MRKAYRYFVILCLLFIVDSSLANPLNWRMIAPGVEYVSVTFPDAFSTGVIHAFRLNLDQVAFKLAFAKNLQQSYATAQDYARYYRALLAINGGFFTPGYESLGLRINDGKLENNIKPISWWGVFYIDNDRPYISSMQSFNHRQGIDFAIQGGPRLIVDGQLVNLKPGLAERTALGITRQGKVIIAVTDNMPLSLTELAQIMAKPNAESGFDCRDALNLDGGTSTQLYVNLPSLAVNVPGFKAVADAIIVLPKVR